MPNNADNISTSTNSGPQYGSGTGGIAHVTGEGAFNFGGSDTTAPNSSSTSFKELIDSGFRKVLENIGFMRQVIERIEFKQNVAIDYLKENIERNKKIDEKIDVLQKTLSKMEDDKRKESASEEMRRREEELEKLTKPLLVSGKERIDGPQDSGGLSSWMFLALPVVAGILGQVFNLAPQIRGFLEFIKGTEKLIMGLTGGGAVAANSGAMTRAGAIAASKFSSIFDATKTGLMASATNYASGLARASMMNVLKWLNRFKFLARSVIVLDAFFTIVYAQATADDPQGVENSFMRAFGKIVGGAGGAWILGSLCGIIAGMIPVVGAFVSPIVLIGGAIVGGYYGTIAGEDFGRALYRFFASDCKDYSGFYDIWKRIQNFLVTKIDSLVPSSSNKPSKPSDGSPSSSGWDREAQKRRDKELQEKMDAITGKPSVGGTPAPSVGGGSSSSFTPSGEKSIRTYSPISDDINDIHKRVSSRSGIDLSVIQSFGDIESSNTNTDNQGRYRGLYQVKGSNDPKFQEDRMVDNLKYYNKIFFETFKRKPDPWEIYLMHQQGEYGGRAICAAYFNGDKNMKAAEGLVKWMKKLFQINFSLENAYTNFKGNIGHTYTGQPKSWTPYYVDLMNKYLKQGIPLNNVIEYLCKNMTINDIYTAFYVGVTDRMKFYSNKNNSSKGRGKAPVSAGMTPVSYSPTEYTGQGSGSEYRRDGVRYDKTGGSNVEALDMITESLRADGLLPSGSNLSYNDDAHEGTESYHEKGLAMDISVSDPKLYPMILAKLKRIRSELGIDFMIFDERKPKIYKHSKAKWSGPHIHIQFYSVEDARKFKEAWNRKYGKPQTEERPEVIANNPSSGEQLMSYGFDSQKPKIIQVTQPVIVQNSDSDKGGKRNSGMSGPIPSAFNPSNRNILMDYL